MSTISSVAISCLTKLKAIASSDDLQIYSAEIPHALWQDELGRLRVWAANIGAHQTGQASLDHRLRDASHIKEQTLRVLRRLQRLLQDLRDGLHPGSGSEDMSDSGDEHGGTSEVQMIYQEVHDTIGNLFQLSMIIRKPAQHDRLRGTKRSDAAGFEPFDMQHVLNKYPQAEPSVLERLGLAISQRRAILRYRERHHLKLGKGLERAIEDRSDAVSTKMSDTVATNFVEQPPTHVGFDSQSLVSQTSYAQTLLNGEEGMVLPPLPAESEDGTPFECPYCFVIISISGDNQWARHVFDDLMPYICVFPDCSTPYRLYESRREWFFHLQNQHSVPIDSGGQLNCPLCSSSVTTGKPFEKHVARHLEELALFALPRSQPQVNPNLSDEEFIGDNRARADSDSNHGSLYRVREYTNEQSPLTEETLRASDTQEEDGDLFDMGYEGDTNSYEDDEDKKDLSLDQSNDSGQPLPKTRRFLPRSETRKLFSLPNKRVLKVRKVWISVESPSRGFENEASQLPDLDNGWVVSLGRPESSTRKVKRTRPIEFTDPMGRHFEFPLEHCSTWEGLEEVIRTSLCHAPDMLAQFEAGKYDIINEAGSVVFPGRWKEIVEPGIRITMRIWPSRQYAIESRLEEGKPYQLSEDPLTINSFLERARYSRLADTRFGVSDWTAAIPDMEDEG
ncbi:uncharacterized protein N7496_012184 [Penicillium cataractarum]|uniref:C2H2-type domain-containing protein n=1 Tax=Penicillium cataractarum TaxID=2100454 RepID=A0A9W9URS6_9EURO|nr:uncharacterized protein N7496_012184 [Penicillium cataractarum]KAJ5354972.1 hypothetical protein N7496_012184 [Penicillium cataractarum]